MFDAEESGVIQGVSFCFGDADDGRNTGTAACVTVTLCAISPCWDDRKAVSLDGSSGSPPCGKRPKVNRAAA